MMNSIIGVVMLDEPIKSPEFNRAIHSINASLEALRNEFIKMRDDLGRRMDDLDDRHNEEMQRKIDDAREEGALQGQLIALEKRLDRQDAWRLATIAPGVVAMIMMIFEWFRDWKR
jgi:hypothetical protein